MASSSHIVGIIPFRQLKLCRNLKDGGYGIVSKAELSGMGVVAYKELHVRYINEREGSQLLKEVGIQAKLSHENIVSVLGFVFEPMHYGLIFEYMPNGDMLDFIAEKKCSWKQKSRMILDVASGMSYLHGSEPPVIHGDLKSENVLIDGNLRAKIADFGFSHWREFSQSKSKNAVRLGTVTHIPPENWKEPNRRKMEPFDVYGFAILMWEAMTAKRPFPAANASEISANVQGGHRPDMKLIPDDVPREAVKLMQSCWTKRHKERPDFESIKTQLEAEKTDSQPGLMRKLSNLLTRKNSKEKKSDEINQSEENRHYEVIDDSLIRDRADPHKRKYRVIYSYEPSESDADVELQLNVDDIIDFIAEEREGWFRGKIGEKVGLIPSNFVEVIPDSNHDNRDIVTKGEAPAKESEPYCVLDSSNLLHGSLSENVCGTEDMYYVTCDTEEVYSGWPDEPEYMNVNSRRTSMLSLNSGAEMNGSSLETNKQLAGCWADFESAGEQNSQIPEKELSTAKGSYETPAPRCIGAPQVYQILSDIDSVEYLQFDISEMCNESNDPNADYTTNIVAMKDFEDCPLIDPNDRNPYLKLPYEKPPPFVPRTQIYENLRMEGTQIVDSDYVCRNGTSETFLQDTHRIMSALGTDQGVSGFIFPDYVPPLDWVKFDD